MTIETPSALEVKNAEKVLGYLSDIDRISYTNLREDIFSVKDNETLLECVVDVEESIVCFCVNICDIPAATDKLNAFLLDANNSAVHGKFATSNGKIVFKDALEFENLDLNELKASLTWAFGMVGSSLEKIGDIIESSKTTLRMNL